MSVQCTSLPQVLMLIKPLDVFVLAVAAPGTVGKMEVTLLQVGIEACHQSRLGLDDILQHAGTGVIPVAGVGVILHQAP